MNYDAAVMNRWQPKGQALQYRQPRWALAHALELRSGRRVRFSLTPEGLRDVRELMEPSA
jgi:hypothetical protein